MLQTNFHVCSFSNRSRLLNHTFIFDEDKVWSHMYSICDFSLVIVLTNVLIYQIAYMKELLFFRIALFARNPISFLN